MTENEAIKEFNKLVGQRMRTKQGISKKQHELFQIAMDTLEEIQQYRALGMEEELRKAIEKQVPKKPNIWGDGYDDKGNMIYDMYDCPNCNKSYEIDYEKYDYCPNCGQAIGFSEVEEWVKEYT